jgi:DNA transformation protein and related proteins
MKQAPRKPVAGRPLKSLRVSPGFRDFVLDQLSNVRDLRAASMFGGVGLYAGDVFFGIVAADVLYLKVDDETRGEYLASGAVPFQPFEGRPTSMSYYSVPPAVFEDPETLARWAARSVVAAERPRAPRARSRRRNHKKDANER